MQLLGAPLLEGASTYKRLELRLSQLVEAGFLSKELMRFPRGGEGPVRRVVFSLTKMGAGIAKDYASNCSLLAREPMRYLPYRTSVGRLICCQFQSMLLEAGSKGWHLASFVDVADGRRPSYQCQVRRGTSSRVLLYPDWDAPFAGRKFSLGPILDDARETVLFFGQSVALSQFELVFGRRLKGKTQVRLAALDAPDTWAA